MSCGGAGARSIGRMTKRRPAPRKYKPHRLAAVTRALFDEHEIDWPLHGRSPPVGGMSGWFFGTRLVLAHGYEGVWFDESVLDEEEDEAEGDFDYGYDDGYGDDGYGDDEADDNDDEVVPAPAP
jgi:hypothetical protein